MFTGDSSEVANRIAEELKIENIKSQMLPQDKYAKLEEELLEAINNMGIGPQGLGGRVTALAVHIEYYPTHIAMLPVAVNINCHVTRHKTEVL